MSESPNGLVHSELPESKGARYINYDLGNYDESMRGVTLRLLENPTRGFRQSFARICSLASQGLEGQSFAQHLATIIGVASVDEMQAAVNDIPDDVFHGLFLWTLDEWDDELKVWKTPPIEPRIIDLWDDYTRTQVKARAARPKS